jgi:membrane fusion protein (multidrug efflux system)
VTSLVVKKIRSSFFDDSNVFRSGQIEFDHVKAKYDASEVKTNMLRKNTSVVAPFSGVVVEYLLEEGENYMFTINLDRDYSNTSGILRLMQLNPLKVQIDVNEIDLQKLEKGMEVNVKCHALGDKEFAGKINYIKPMLSTTTRTATVEILVKNPGNKIFPGMFAEVEINYGQQSGLFVPINSVFRQPGTPEDFVFVEKDNIVERRHVEKIKTQGEYVCVKGLELGEVVVVEGKNKLVNGDTVKIIL